MKNVLLHASKNEIVDILDVTSLKFREMCTVYLLSNVSIGEWICTIG